MKRRERKVGDLVKEKCTFFIYLILYVESRGTSTTYHILTDNR